MMIGGLHTYLFVRSNPINNPIDTLCQNIINYYFLVKNSSPVDDMMTIRTSNPQLPPFEIEVDITMTTQTY